MQAKLLVVGGEVKTKEVKLRLPTIIGRGEGATLLLPHPLVSRKHCELFEVQGKLVVRDLGSLNGTYVNNEKIAESIIEPGELLTIGSVTFRAMYESPSLDSTRTFAPRSKSTPPKSRALGIDKKPAASDASGDDLDATPDFLPRKASRPASPTPSTPSPTTPSPTTQAPGKHAHARKPPPIAEPPTSEPPSETFEESPDENPPPSPEGFAESAATAEAGQSPLDDAFEVGAEPSGGEPTAGDESPEYAEAADENAADENGGSDDDDLRNFLKNLKR